MHASKSPLHFHLWARELEYLIPTLISHWVRLLGWAWDVCPGLHQVTERALQLEKPSGKKMHAGAGGQTSCVEMVKIKRESASSL